MIDPTSNPIRLSPNLSCQPEPPQVIFLDAVGTLFGIQGSVGEIYQRFAQAAGIEVDAAALNKAFFQSFAAAPKAAFPGVDPAQLPELEYAWWRAVAAESFTRVGVYPQFADFEVFFRPLFNHFLTAAPWQLYPEVPAVLAAWQRQGIRLGVLSNFDSRLYAVLKALELRSFFSSVTISTQVGAAKPDPGIFQAALAAQQLELSVGGAWHIGDSWAEDVVGAAQMGLTPIWLNRKNPTFADDGRERQALTQSVYGVSQLADLPH
jgi:putative hydrolase of the HAD superfamily